MTAQERLLDALLQNGCAVKDLSNGKTMAQCPAHDDNSPSLSIGPRRDGKGVVIKCHAGCDTPAVLQALNFPMADLFDEPKVRAIFEPRRDYRYPGGRVVHRKPGKNFPQSVVDGDHSLFGSDRITDTTTTVYVVEGEKDVEAVQAAGGVAVCSAMGAGKAHLADWSVLAGKDVTVVADRDEPGRKHADDVVLLLHGVAESVRVVEVKAGKDFADHFAADEGLDEFVELSGVADATPDPESVAAENDPDRPLYPAPSAPLRVAKKIYCQFRNDDTARTLLAWRGGWQRWQGPHWSELDPAELRSLVYEELDAVDYERPIMEKGIVVDFERTPWNPDKRKVANVLEAMQAVGHLSSEIDPPAWIDSQSVTKTPAAQMISCANGLLDLSTRTVHVHTPAMFNAVSVPFDYDGDAPPPTAWLQFLDSVWSGDADSIALLQEYVGYVLSGRTDMQKMLMLIGPTRSGKGTVARMLAELVGRGHVAGPTLASLGTNFGLSPLLGKPLAVISDARLGNEPAHTIVERLLSITGEDMLTIDRKFRDPWSGKLPTRFVILSNELPRFRDASGAIANRLVILQMTNSFLGREDRTLDERLRSELPGILNWSLEGLDRLTRTGRFTVPSASGDAVNLMMDLSSPVSAFVRDCCRRKPDASVAADTLYTAWKSWAEDNGHRAGAKSTFGRDLRAVVPEIKVTQPTEGGIRVRTYVCIGLLPVHPVQDIEPAGHSDGDGGGVTDSSRAVPVQPELPAPTCTGCGTHAEHANLLVNGHCTGCTGINPFKAQGRQP